MSTCTSVRYSWTNTNCWGHAPMFICWDIEPLIISNFSRNWQKGGAVTINRRHLARSFSENAKILYLHVWVITHSIVRDLETVQVGYLTATKLAVFGNFDFFPLKSKCSHKFLTSLGMTVVELLSLSCEPHSTYDHTSPFHSWVHRS